MAKPPEIKFIDLEEPEQGTVVVFTGEGKRGGEILKKLDKKTGGQISKAMSLAEFEGKKNQNLELLLPANLDLDKIIVIGTAGLRLDIPHQWTLLGGRLAALSKKDLSGRLTVIAENNGDDITCSNETTARLALGIQLRTYQFDKYKSKSDADNNHADAKTPTELSIACAAPDATAKLFKDKEALRGGIFLARDLVNEPANFLGPEQFAAQVEQLGELGVDVEILDEKAMSDKGMNALLAVGRGSARPSYLAVMYWQGKKSRRQKPVAIVGKGVCFDTGGISIKPAQGMEDMKGDMGGAACVTGLMHTLASRRAKVNAVGVIGLVENMPGGKAQRPGDVVTSMSGKTIEVLNTDAEGRLVLADALTYTIETFNPKIVIDLATLTGAILVALGKVHAGLFSNDDGLAEQLLKAGEKSGETLWRMPLGEKYDKLIDSQIADMKNLGGRFAGSVTAAQFLQRFVDDMKWAHIDIAGTAMASPKNDINQSWGSGFGVSLLDELIASYYE